jgi:hypothetical protein
VIYTVTSGTATLACGKSSCPITATGDGRASMNVTAVDGNLSIVTTALTNGSSLQAQFAGGTPPTLAALTPQLSLVAGATFTWTVQALVLSNGAPAASQSVAWQTNASGIGPSGAAAAITSSAGIATQTLTAGPLAEGQVASINACLNGTSQCVAFTAVGARPEYARLEAVSGTAQSLPVQSTPAQVTLRLLDMDGNPMAGGSVSFYQAVYAWAPPCPAHGACPPSNLLATQTAAAGSAADGTVTFTPASIAGVSTRLLGEAASGNTAVIEVDVEQHP